jgi:S-formylglutathione hydrolase FrmB
MNAALWATLTTLPLLAPLDGVTISGATNDSNGFLVHEVTAPYQQGKPQVRVLLPDVPDADKKYPVVYVLPVEAQNASRYGDGLVEVQKRDLHNKHHLIFAAPSFSELPWYADHPTNETLRQETHFLKVILPFVERTYPVQAGRQGRLLLGFSKSGWGAWSLLLRYPSVFGRAAAWDAPLAMDRLGSYGTADIFGTEQNFERYRITALLRAQPEILGAEKRLILTGYGNFRPDHEKIHSLLVELKVPHEYRDGPKLEHHWHSGWVPQAVELLVSGD